MSGINYTVCSRTLYDFSQVAASNNQELVIAKAVPVSMYREATLLLRNHTGGTITSTQTVDVRCRIEAPSDDDPTSDFVNSTELGTAQLTSSTGAPALIVVALSFTAYQNFGSFLRIFVRGTQSGGGGTLKAYISVDLALKTS